MPEAEFREWLTYLAREPDAAALTNAWMAQLVAAVYAVPFLSHGRTPPVRADALFPRDPWAAAAVAAADRAGAWQGYFRAMAGRGKAGGEGQD